MKKLIFELFIKEWKNMLILLAGIFAFCVMLFFADIYFGWNKRVTIQVSQDYLFQFQRIEQPFFEFQSYNSPNGNIQLLNIDSKWILKNGNQLGIGLKKELMSLCMQLKDNGFTESDDSFKNDLLIIYSCLILIVNGAILMIKDDVNCFKLKKERGKKVELLTLICRLVFVDSMIVFILIVCMMLRNGYDRGQGWLLWMRRYGLIRQLYDSFDMFLYDHASNLLNSMLAILICSIFFALILFKLFYRATNKKGYVFFFVGAIIGMYLLNEWIVFQSHFPDLIEYIPGIGFIFVISSICSGNYELGNVLFSILIDVMVIIII